MIPLDQLPRSRDDRNREEQLIPWANVNRVAIKLQPARMSYQARMGRYMISLIDTPDIDFTYEVSRSLAAVGVPFY